MPALVDAVLARFGRLDCFVSNAGIGALVRGDLLELEPENFDRGAWASICAARSS